MFKVEQGWETNRGINYQLINSWSVTSTTTKTTEQTTGMRKMNKEEGGDWRKLTKEMATLTKDMKENPRFSKRGNGEKIVSLF